MNTLKKICACLILTTITGFSILAQEDKQIPNKEKTPRVVVKEKDDDKQQNKNRDNENKNRDNNKDMGNKRPSIR